MTNSRLRRRPHPYDATLSINDGLTYTGIMLGKPNDKTSAGLVSSVPPDQSQVTPSDYGYDAANPILGKWESWRNLGRGMGFKVQEKPEDMGYDHCINADLSLGYVWLKGPNISTITPTPLQKVITSSGVASNKGGGLVGIPCAAHGFGSGEPIAITGTTNYNANYSVDATSTEDEIVVAATYTAETFGAGARVNYRPDITHYFVVGTTLYALGGRVCLVRAGDDAGDWSMSKDFGSGNAAVDVVVFFSNASGGAETAYVAMGDSQLIWKFTGGTWTQYVEVQTVTISGTPTGGHYHLGYGAEWTGNLAWNASAATVQTALRLLTGLGSVTVTATGTSPNFTHTVTFTGVAGNATTLTSDVSDLTGGTPSFAHASNELRAQAFCVVGREFYRAHSTNTLAKCDTDADPFDFDDWGAENAFTVGDKNSAIVRLSKAVGGELLIYKTDGIYTLREDGEDVPLFPFLEITPAATSGKAHGAWINDEYVAYGNSTYRVRPDLSIEQVGPEKLTANDSDVKGYISAFQGHETFNLYAAIYNQDIDSSAGASYLLKFGTWMSGGGGEATRLDAWHGSISAKFAAKKINALFKSTVGAATGHSRLYLGFSDGTVGWLTLPCVPNPAGCTQYTFSTANGEIYVPQWHGMFKNDIKPLRAFAILGENLSGTNYAQVEYALDGASSYTALADSTPTTYNFDNASGRERNEFPDNTSCTTAKLKIVLVSTATNSCPRLTGCGLNYNVKDEQLRQVFSFLVLAADGLVKRDGSRVRLGPSTIRELVQDARNRASFTMVFPDEVSREVGITSYGESVAWNDRLRRWQSAIALEVVEYSTNLPKGLYSTLNAYTYGLLESLSYGDMEIA